MAKLSSNESSFVFSIYKTHHKANDLIIILLIVPALAFTIIGAPIITALCNLPLGWNIALFIGPVPLVTIILLIRKKIILDNFLKEKNIEGKVEISNCASNMFTVNDGERVFMFADSENMPVVIYNWFNGFDVIKGGCLKMTRILYDNYAPKYLAVDMDDLQITEENSDVFKKETAQNLRFSDVNEQGRVVNVNLYSRVTKAE